MTYSELQVQLRKLTKDQLGMSVTVLVGGEYFPATLKIINNSDVLDQWHPCIELQESIQC